MKPVHGAVGSQSCSCTSCLYRSDSENPSVRRFLRGGSKIDRLYLGKYIPLRERKLLNRLVRTRAVYDDIRNQLLSGSSASLGRNDPSRSIESDDTEKSSAILRMVDLVDKGKILKHKDINLDECCSCCACGPNLQEYDRKPRRHRHGRKQYGGGHSMSGTSMFSKQRDGFRPKGFSFKPTSIKSEPCTCITKLSEVLKRRSQEIRKKLRHESSKSMLEAPSLVDYYDILKTLRKRKPLRRTYQKIKKSNSRLMQSMGEGVRKIRDSKDKLKDYIDDGTRRSIDKIKEVKKKIKDNLKSDAQKSEDEFEGLDFNLFPIQKDSIAKYKELLESRRRRFLHKYKACEWECYPDECDPKECFRILKLRRRRKRQKEEDIENNENRQRNLRNKVDEPSDVTKRKIQKEGNENRHRNLLNEVNETSGVTNIGGKGQALEREVIIRNKSGKILRYEKLTHNIPAEPQVNTNIKRGEANQIESSEQQKKTIFPKGYHTSVNADKRNEKARKVKPIKENMPSNIHGRFKDQPGNLKRRNVRVPSSVSSSIESMISIPKDMSRSLSLYSRSREHIQQHPGRKSKRVRTPQKYISSSKTFSMPDVTKVDQRYRRPQPARKKIHLKKQGRTHSENFINATANRPSRQAVKISSSLSFSIEFSRNKRKSPVATQKKDRIQNTTAMIQRDTNSKTKVRKSKPDQSSVDRLKRCFCTLKFMTRKKRTKGNKIVAKPVATQSRSTLDTNEIQFKVENRTQTNNSPPRLDTFACPPDICIPNECDPIECLKVITKHKMKDRSTGENVKTKKSKSVSSYISESILNVDMKNTTPRRKAKTKIKQKPVAQRSLKRKQAKQQESTKQAVRINSTFSFSVEFKKEKYNDNAVPTVNIMPHRKSKWNQDTTGKEFIRNKRSHFSTSTTKSKYTLTKHSLRRCFCTLKLAQTGKRKLKTKTNQFIHVESKNVPRLESHVVTRSVNTGKERNILLYECEPGICVPGECDPNICLKVISKRRINSKKRLSKFSNTNYHGSKSTSSFTSKTPHKKAKLIQSSDFPSTKQKEKKNILKPTPSSPEQQIVRIGSSFSFNIEFYKDKQNNKVLSQIQNATKKIITKKPGTLKTPNLEEQGSEGNIKHKQKSTTMLGKRNHKSSATGPSMKRTLKLQKAGNGYWDQNVQENVTVGTITPITNAYNYNKQMITRSTKTKPVKLKVRHKLKPYECEPFVCVPGECNPYECLQRIQNRKYHSKELGTETDRSKLKSASSMTQKLNLRSKAALVKSNSIKLHKRKPSKTKIKNKLTLKPRTHQISHRQAVRVGSNFSFNIEFQKTKCKSHPKVTEIHKIPLKHTLREANNKDTSPKTKPTANRNTGYVKIKKHSKSTGIRPILKRCFCTLKLQGSTEEKLQSDEKSSKPLKTYNDHSKIYTVSRLTIDRTEGIKKVFNVIDTEVQNDISEIGKSYSNSRSYLNMNSLTRASCHSTKVLSRFATNTFQSNLVLPTFYSKLQHKINCSESFLLLKRCNCKQSMSQKSLNSDFLYENGLQYTNATQLLEQHYYAMNIHVPERSKNLYKKLYKLQPYECEPGVCVPYECNRYECQKLIMKRLMKGASKMSGTDIKSRSISSSAAQSVLSSTKQLQSRQTRHKKEKLRANGIKYKSHPNRINKQTVRVGSSFNFNIEFFRDQRAKNEEHARKHMSPKPSRTISRPSKTKSKHLKSTGAKKLVAKRRDRDSQSVIKTEHRGSGMSPLMERCFCTLKLQKRGRHHRKESYSFDKGIGTPSNILIESVEMTADSSQNTDRLKPLKLLPYECEPQICIPGECDPYECLERIKIRNRRRKDFGTGISPSKKSNSSMITKNQVTTHTQGKQINPKVKREARFGEKTTRFVQSKPPRRDAPSRQAVRIGSNFSFNIDFFKENSNNMPMPPYNREKILQQRKTRRGAKSTTSAKGTKQKVLKSKLKNIGSQDFQLTQDQNSQIGNMLSHASTMTASFMKRCFCTAKLYQKEHRINESLKSKTFQGKEQHVNENLNAVKTKGSEIKNVKLFLHRCFCALKFKGTRTEKPPAALTKSNVFTETKNGYNLAAVHKIATPRENIKKYRLEPYECEPGVCIPGQCDPYDCEKLIKARILQNDSKAVITDKPRTKSMSSSFKSSKTSKVKVRQQNLKKNGASRNRQTTIVKRSPPYKSVGPITRTSSNRQVVRIGSQLSFNIEFYKDRKFKADEVQAAAKAIKHKPNKTPHKRRRKSDTENKALKFKNRGVTGISMVGHDQESQVLRETQDQATGVGHLLKRCFCTLTLQKQNEKQIEMSTQGTDTPAFKEIPTLYSRGVMTEGRKWKLKPYECEPNVCVPYECDPYECDKLIKKRLMKGAHKGTTIMKNERDIAYELEPYECEPNTCVPGECNPYECADRIRLRNMKYKESGTLTKKFKSKSVTSGVHSTTSSKPRKTQSMKRKENNRRSKSGVSKSYQPKKIYDSSFIDSTRQSVRIGSGLSFDIEFYKNKSQNEHDAYKPKKTKQRNRSNTSSFTRQMRNRKMQHLNGVRDIDSQVLRNMQDTGVNTLLKRCFCTLKLQNTSNTSNRSKKLKRFTSPKFGTISRAARDRNVYLATFAKLLPYECEPGVCISGECDPYECDKRIKKRLLLSQTTETDRPQRYSKSSSTFSSKRNTMSQAKREPKYRSHPRPSYVKRNYIESYPEPENNFDDHSSCRVGSSLNFNIEFYKKRGGTDLYHTSKLHKSMLSDRGASKRRKTESKSINSNKARRRHNKLETSQPRTESKSIGVDSLPKRCFCTLALQKHLEDPLILQNKCLNTCMKEKFLLSKEKGVGTRKYIPILDPYECEPYVCIPGECDPYECYERIKLRRMRDNGTDTLRTSQKYAASSCGDPECKDAATQFMKANQRKEITTAKPRKSEQVSHRYFEAPATNNITRFGSNISFNIEFYKERNAENRLPKRIYKTNALDNTSLITSKTYKQNGTYKNIQNKSSYFKNRSNDNKVQVDSVQTATRGTGMCALLKKCFCTFGLRNNRNKKAKIQNNEKIILPNVNNNTNPKAIIQNNEKVIFPNVKHTPKTRQEKPVITCTEKVKQIPNVSQMKSQIKKASNKDSKKVKNQNIYPTGGTKSPNKHLKDYECEPNVCIPEECDPHECLERIKKRQLRRQSRRAATYVRPSRVSASSMISKLVPRRSKRVQSTVKRIHQISQPQEVQTIVEEPRFVHMFDNPNIYTTRYGSNIHFNIEFYKKKSQFPATKVPFYKEAQYKKPRLGQADLKKIIDVECKPILKHEAVAGNTCRLSSCGAQVDHIKTKDKAAGVHNILKRCFCTLKLQKDESHYATEKVHKLIKVNRLAIDKTWINTNCHLEHQIKSKSLNNRNITIDPKRDLNNKIRKPERRKNDHSSILETIEMQTIYPYIPSKFHKHVSKTGILQIEGLKKHSNRIQSPVMKHKLIDQIKLVKKSNKIKETHNRKTPIYSLKSLMANILKRILMFSKNKTSLVIENNNKINESMYLKRAHRNHLSALKTSKSERPTNFKVSAPKKSLSLKVTKFSDENKNKHENFPCHSKKIIYSQYQCGDNDKKLLKSGYNHKKSPGPSFKRNEPHTAEPINKNKKVMDPPFEDYKIVQMALLTKKSKKEKPEFGETNETQNPAAHKMSGHKFSHKCLCSMSGKKIENIKQTVNEDGIIAIKNNNINMKRKSLFASGDISDEITRAGKVKIKQKTIKNNAIKIAPTQSGDAPTTGKDFVYVKKTKNKKDQSESKEICDYPQSCPCCKNRAPKKGNKTKWDKILENVVEKGIEDGKIKKKGKINSKIKDAELKGILKKYENISDFDVRGKNIGKAKIDKLKSKMDEQNKIQNAKLGKQNILNQFRTNKPDVSYKQKFHKHNIKTDKQNVIQKNKIDKQNLFNKFKTDKRNTLDKVQAGKQDYSAEDQNLIQKSKPKKQNIFSKFIKNKQNVLNKVQIDKLGIKTDEQNTIQKNKTDNKTNILDEQNINQKSNPDKKKSEKVKGKKNKRKNMKDIESKSIQFKQRKKKVYGVKLSIKPKGDPTAKREIIVPDYTLLKHTKINKICTCGSKKCTKELKQLIAKQKRGGAKSKAPCVCGSDVCTTETWRKSLRRGKICECQKALKKLEEDNHKKKMLEEEKQNQLKADMIYDKKQKKEHKYRQKIRIKQERRLDREAEKYKNNSDTALVVDSLVDVLRLGFRAGSDVAECTSKAVFNPKRTLRGLNMAVRDPNRAFSNMKSAIDGSGLFSTARRIKLRFRAMKSVQSLKSRLEENEVTGFLYNMRDKKARERIKKKRMQKKQKKDKPETDFECSPFMASLRKRPCLAVYYLCPWFYPHFLSMLNLWKQFTDVLLFLLAVAVWSPFILCMEICRAMVCCFFCTG